MKKDLFIRFYKGYFIKYKKKSFLIIVLMIVSSLLSITFPYLNKKFIDSVLIQKEIEYFKPIILAMIGIGLIQIILFALQEYAFSYISENIIKNLKNDLFKNILRLNNKYLEKSSTGDLLTRLQNDVELLQQVISSVFIEVIANIISMIFICCFMIYLNWKMTLISLIFIITYYFIYNYFSKVIKKQCDIKMNFFGKINGKVTEMLSNISTIKVFNSYNWAENKTRKNYDSLYKTNMTLKKYYISNVSLTLLILTLSSMILWYIGGIDVIRGDITLGTITAFLSCQSKLFSPLRLFSDINSQIQSTATALERIYEIMDCEKEENENEDEENRMELGKEFRGKVEFKNVSFSYNKTDKVLNNINFEINSNELVAIVGMSGSGKTSIIKLLTGFYKDYDGEILLDDRNIKNIKLSNLRDNITLVEQDVSLFSSTIKENILLGNENIGEKKIQSILKDVGIYTYVDNLPNKLDSLLSEEGNNISGGQKKRLQIARVLIRNTKILILDEPFNSLDNTLKFNIKQTLLKLKSNHTIILITHNYEELDIADKILVLNKGNIESYGSHNELINESETYRDLFYDSCNKVLG